MGSASSVLWNVVPVAVAAPPDCTVSPVWTEAGNDRVESTMETRPADCTVSPAEPLNDRVESTMETRPADCTVSPAEPLNDMVDPTGMLRVVPLETVTPPAKFSTLAKVAMATCNTIVVLKVSTQLSSVS
jgi:hypothetical protein